MGNCQQKQEETYQELQVVEEIDEVKLTKYELWKIHLSQLKESQFPRAKNGIKIIESMPYHLFTQQVIDKLAQLGKFKYPNYKIESKKKKNDDDELEDDYILLGIYSENTYFLPQESLYYQGEWYNKLSYGKGQLMQITLDLKTDQESMEYYYEGEFKDGMMHGKGRKIYQDGSYYIGNFRNDQMEDKNGKYISSDGTQISGNIKYDLPFGKQVMIIYPDGSVYNGNMLNGMRHGFGRFEWQVKGSGQKLEAEYYDGEWFNDMKQGKGKYHWKDGRSYEGEWKNDMMDGEGEFTWKNGVKYVGGYKMDKRQGQGIVHYPSDNKKRWKGFFQDGKQHGKGYIIVSQIKQDMINQVNPQDGKGQLQPQGESGADQKKIKDGLDIVYEDVCIEAAIWNQGKFVRKFTDDEFEDKNIDDFIYDFDKSYQSKKRSKSTSQQSNNLQQNFVDVNMEHKRKGLRDYQIQGDQIIQLNQSNHEQINEKQSHKKNKFQQLLHSISKHFKKIINKAHDIQEIDMNIDINNFLILQKQKDILDHMKEELDQLDDKFKDNKVLKTELITLNSQRYEKKKQESKQFNVLDILRIKTEEHEEIFQEVKDQAEQDQIKLQKKINVLRKNIQQRKQMKEQFDQIGEQEKQDLLDDYI